MKIHFFFLFPVLESELSTLMWGLYVGQEEKVDRKQVDPRRNHTANDIHSRIAAPLGSYWTGAGCTSFATGRSRAFTRASRSKSFTWPLGIGIHTSSQAFFWRGQVAEGAWSFACSVAPSSWSAWSGWRIDHALINIIIEKSSSSWPRAPCLIPFYREITQTLHVRACRELPIRTTSPAGANAHLSVTQTDSLYRL